MDADLDLVVWIPISVLRICREELHAVLHNLLQESWFSQENAERLANVINALGDGDAERAKRNPIIARAKKEDGVT